MRVAVVTSGFPRRSETFALGELLSLEEAGVLASVFATKPGDGLRPHPDAARLQVPVRVLPAGTIASQAAVLAAELRDERIDAVHGYFAHAPAALAAAAARSLGVPYGFSVHARDARKVSRATLARRSNEAACVIACNQDVAREIPASNGHLHVVPHGVDLERFAPSEPRRNGVGRVLAVGRLVEKKGFDVLVAAAALARTPFEIRIVGDGPERQRLEAQIARTGLGNHIRLVGGRTHDDLPGEYAEADVVAVPSVTDGMGDRDGLPNVVLEAMASARPVVATCVGAIPSAVVDGTTGRLVAADDPAALAEAIEAMLRDRDLLARAGRAGRRRAERDFSLLNCTRRFRSVLEQAYG
jgi:colanic acid/amylovoran biosynthesis glycosyltransferase